MTTLGKLLHYGVAELVGEIAIVKGSIPTRPQRTARGILRIFYDGVITNSFAGAKYVDSSTGTIGDQNGITIQFTDEYVAASNSGQISASVTNKHQKDEVAIEIPPDIYLHSDGPTIRVRGVRVDCSAKAVGTLINAHVSSDPFDAMTFVNSSLVPVGEVNESLVVEIHNSGSSGAPTIRLTEGFSGAFVQHTGTTLNPRGRFGANAKYSAAHRPFSVT
jgi:hypothetical protein